MHQTESPSARWLVFDLFILRLICPKETCVPLSEWLPASRDSVLCSRDFVKWNVTLCEIIRVARMKLCCLFLVDAQLCVVGKDRHAGWRPCSLNVAHLFFIISARVEFLIFTLPHSKQYWHLGWYFTGFTNNFKSYTRFVGVTVFTSCSAKCSLTDTINSKLLKCIPARIHLSANPYFRFYLFRNLVGMCSNPSKDLKSILVVGFLKPEVKTNLKSPYFHIYNVHFYFIWFLTKYSFYELLK